MLQQVDSALGETFEIVEDETSLLFSLLSNYARA